MPRSRISLGVFALLLALALASLPARAFPVMPAGFPLLAETRSEPPSVQQAQSPGPLQEDIGGFSRSQLEAYADAVVKVQELDRAWQPRIDQAESEAEAETLVTQATDEMVGEIEAQGLSVQEYNAIPQAAERDDRLYEHIMTLLAQR